MQHMTEFNRDRNIYLKKTKKLEIMRKKVLGKVSPTEWLMENKEFLSLKKR